MKVEFLKSIYRIEDYKPFRLPEVAFAGRSNVGKSSLINTLLNCKIAHTSKKPGKTKAVNFFKVEDRLILVDLPGYGYSAVPKKLKGEWKELIEGYIENSPFLKMVFILVDAKRGIEEEEKQLMEWLEYLKRPFTIVFTKIDKLSKNEVAQLKKEMEDKNPIFFSSLTKVGKKEIFSKLKELQCL